MNMKLNRENYQCDADYVYALEKAVQKETVVIKSFSMAETDFEMLKSYCRIKKLKMSKFVVSAIKEKINRDL
jgi:hypothetical protein